jgi:hypothetical protein
MQHQPRRELAHYREAPLEAGPDAELARLALEPHLAPGERIVWTGRPPLGVRLTSEDIFIIPFSLLWGGFSILWEIRAIHQAAWLHCLFGLPFVAIGQHLLLGRFFSNARQRAHTFYGLTSSRALIVNGGRTTSVNSMSLAAAHEIRLTTGRDGRGTIAFPRSGETAGPSFTDVAAVHEVYQRILALQAEARRSPP